MYQLFKDPEEFKYFLVEESQIMTPVEATLFMNSSLLLSGMLDRLQGGRRQGSCQDKIKSIFLTVDDRSVSQFSSVACHLAQEEISDLIEVLHLNTDLEGILNQAGAVVDHVSEYELWNLLDDFSYFERMVIDLESIGGRVDFFDENPIFYLDLWIPELTDCIESLEDKETEQGDWAM